MVYGFWAFAMVAICCEMGQQYSNAYENMDGVIVLHLDWYLLPMKIQRMLPTIKINTQQPFEVKCFGSSTCCRETFKKVWQLTTTTTKKIGIYTFQLIVFTGGKQRVFIFYGASKILQINSHLLRISVWPSIAC